VNSRAQRVQRINRELRRHAPPPEISKQERIAKLRAELKALDDRRTEIHGALRTLGEDI
jgi:hypothetical protein